jgi:hypothetical protein
MAPRYLCPAIGLAGHRWPWLAARGSGEGDGWWKLEALQEDVSAAGPSRIVWIDDQLRYEHDAQAWAGILGARILAISPHPRRGISPAELAAVNAFVTDRVF